MTWNPNFSYPPPLFTGNGFDDQKKSWEECVYYWWYEYLKCNKEYEICCDKKRDPFTRSKRHKLDKLYSRFGDIHALNFQDWWEFGERGKELFSERGSNIQFGVIEDYEDIQPWDFSQDVVFLRLPLRTQSKRSLKQDFAALLDNLHKGKPGKRTFKTSQAIYKVLGRPKMASLKLHLEIYKFSVDNPKVPQWKIFQHFNLYNKHNFKDYSVVEPQYGCKLTMNATVSRHLKIAKTLIGNTVYGRFPDYSNKTSQSKPNKN